MKRFPREEAQKCNGENSFSMNHVYVALELVAEGQPVRPKQQALINRWFGIECWTPGIAKQILHPDFDGHLRFRRA